MSLVVLDMTGTGITGMDRANFPSMLNGVRWEAQRVSTLCQSGWVTLVICHDQMQAEYEHEGVAGVCSPVLRSCIIPVAISPRGLSPPWCIDGSRPNAIILCAQPKHKPDARQTSAPRLGRRTPANGRC